MPSTDYPRRILSAQVYDLAVRTPLHPMPRLSQRLGRPVLLKREDLQPSFSFKVRGACNKIASLPPNARSGGLICASAGNHAQGVALAAQKFGCKALIVMPRTTPRIKVDAVAGYGAEVILHGDSYDEAYARARELERECGLTFIHPYDDPDVIAGQGTVAVELLQQHAGPLGAIVVPVGGGGLISGITAYVSHLRPDIPIVSAEAEDSDGLRRALAAGKRVMLEQVGLFADGTAVRQVGQEPFEIVRDVVKDAVVVTNDEICAAIKDIYEDLRVVAEPAGALGIAALKQWAAAHPGETPLAAILSGANMNFGQLRYVAERTDLGEQSEALFGVTIPERAGSFLSFCTALGRRRITEFNYRYASPEQAHVFVGVGLERGHAEAEELHRHLVGLGYEVVDLSGDEVAKLHVRYMVGGPGPGLQDERLYRFEFPERPGALRDFLEALAHGWNISLFHYRNHGADYGRVLAGIQVPEHDWETFERALSELGYPHWAEAGNPAYQMFLSGLTERDQESSSASATMMPAGPRM
jgi:threonine dehydratase